MLVIYDLEFTTWPGAQERNWTDPGEFREIVQIGALRVDPALRVESSFEALIRPSRNPVLSPYFEALTGITNEAVAADGQDFPSALNAFLKFCNGDYALSYGNDMVVVGENLILQFPPRGRAHNALADCHGILEALRHLRRQGHPLIGIG